MNSATMKVPVVLQSGPKSLRCTAGERGGGEGGGIPPDNGKRKSSGSFIQ